MLLPGEDLQVSGCHTWLRDFQCVAGRCSVCFGTGTGIAAAKGAYIGFCDADDLWLPEKLELHIRHLQENPDVGISFAGSSLIDRDGKFVGMPFDEDNQYDLSEDRAKSWIEQCKSEGLTV